TIHHIISDGWSVKVFFHELTALYKAFYYERSVPLEPLPIQYVDFSLWQQDWLASDEFTAQLAYWQRQLANVPAMLELPTDHPRPVTQTFNGRNHSFALPASLTDMLGALSRNAGTTLFMTMLAAFSVLLSHYTGQVDVCIGVPLANRNKRELEELIGFFVNTLVFRIDLSDDPHFFEVLRRVRDIAVNAYENQELPFEKLVDELQPTRDMSHTPLFQVMFDLANEDMTLELPGLTLDIQEVDTATAKFDLQLLMKHTSRGLSGQLEYNTDLFQMPTIERMQLHLHRLLEEIVANPDQKISRLLLLDAAERQQILVGWNATQKPYPNNTCIHHMIEAQVERTPHNIALVFENLTKTYQELNNEANLLAAILQEQGVKPETLVGVCMERSLELVVALLAILKAGGAYVPLDPTYPQERLNYMLEDARISILLTQSHILERLPREGIHCILLDPGWNAAMGYPQRNCYSSVLPDNLVYMIYTSGSTGKPKGALNTHRSLCNRLHWMQCAYQLTEEDRVLQKTPFSFDVSVWEFFWPLLTGARLVIARPAGHQDPAYLASLIQQEAITTLHFVPSMLQAFLTEPALEEKCRSL